jgi:hypothetical protein
MLTGKKKKNGKKRREETARAHVDPFLVIFTIE